MMLRKAMFWMAMAAMPFAVLAIITYLPDRIFANVSFPVTVAIIEALALTPGIALMVFSSLSRRAKWLGSAVYVLAYAPFMPFAFLAIACTLHYCDL